MGARLVVGFLPSSHWKAPGLNPPFPSSLLSFPSLRGRKMSTSGCWVITCDGLMPEGGGGGVLGGGGGF